MIPVENNDITFHVVTVYILSSNPAYIEFDAKQSSELIRLQLNIKSCLIAYSR